MNDPLYNHVVFGPTKGKGGIIGKSDDQLIQDLIAIHNAENWLGMDGDAELVDGCGVADVVAGHLPRFQTRLPPEWTMQFSY